ncbi:MAG: ligase-associated DNA damage response endonuclease PdeM [Sphingobacteriales bacterium]|nr:MAG: ligase-associated DNA damage response endonuclease PdeM [Sphingobacteriales bacterium]
MQAPVLFEFKGQKLWLSGQRALYWEDEGLLLLSDLHLGKSGHFRKEGIAVPGAVMKEDMQRLLMLVQHFRPRKLVVVGDFFHSRANVELDLFSRWRADIAAQPIVLIRGNHDILSDEWYSANDIEVVEGSFRSGAFCLAHDPADASPGLYTFCGHVHPGVVLNGLARQSLRLPCFYFAQDYCILPAFGRFTGLATVHPKRDETVYIIAEDKVMKLS